MPTWSSSTQPAHRKGVDNAKKKTEDQFIQNLDAVKGILKEQCQDPTIMHRTLQIFTGMLEQNFNPTDMHFHYRLKNSMVGFHVLSDQWAAGTVYVPFGNALIKLTEADKVCSSLAMDKILDSSALFAKMEQKGKAAANRAARVAGDQVEVAGVSASPGQHGPPGASQPRRTEDDFDVDRKEMLEFLKPLFELIEYMPDALKASLAPNWPGDSLMRLKQAIGSAIFAIMSHDTESRGSHTPGSLRRAAICGAESIGKTTFIKFLARPCETAIDKDFLPAGRGKVTRSVTYISHFSGGDMFQKSWDSKPEPCDDVHEEVKGIATAIAADSVNRKLVGQPPPLSVNSLNVQRAYREFRPPQTHDPLELMDVPGTCTETEFQNALALSVASSLVLVVGDLEDLKLQFDPDGGLSLLKNLVSRLDKHIPIVCVVVRDLEVPEAAFTPQLQAFYIQFLKSQFPGHEVTVTWCGYASLDPLKRKTKALSILSELARHEVRPVDPYQTFNNLFSVVTKFENCFNSAMEEILAPKFSPDFRELLATTHRQVQTYNTGFTKTCVSNIMKAHPLEVELKKVMTSEKDYPVCSVALGNQRQECVCNLALISGELLLEINIATFSWLLTQGDNMHRTTISDRLESLAQSIVCERNRMTMEGGKGLISTRATVSKRVCDVISNLESSRDVEFGSKLGRYMSPVRMKWVIAGFHSVATYSRIERIMMKDLQEAHADDSPDERVRDQMLELQQQTYRFLSKVPIKGRCDNISKQLRNHAPLESAFRQIMDSIVKSSEEFQEVLQESKLVSGWNVALNELLKMIWVMLYSTVVFQPLGNGANASRLSFTALGRHLQSHTKEKQKLKRQLQKFCMPTEEESLQSSVRAANELVMQMNVSTEPKWKKDFDDARNAAAEASALCESIFTAFNKDSAGGAMLVAHKAMDDGDTFFVGQRVYYFSRSMRQWIPATITGAHEDEIQLDVKPLWMSLKVEPADGGCKGAVSLTLPQGAVPQGTVLMGPPGSQGTQVAGVAQAPHGLAQAPPQIAQRAQDSVGQHLPILLNSVRVHRAPQWEGDANSHSKQVILQVQERGSSVVVFARNPGNRSVDPIGLEEVFLQEVSREPHINVVLVLWTPKPGFELDKDSLNQWRHHAGDVRVEMVLIKSEEDMQNFHDVILPDELVRADREVKYRMEKKRRDAEEHLHRVSNVAVQFRSELQTRSDIPYDFHVYYESKVREQFATWCRAAEEEAASAGEAILTMPIKEELETTYIRKYIVPGWINPEPEKGSKGRSIASAMKAFTKKLPCHSCPFSGMKKQLAEEEKEDALLQPVEASACSIEELEARVDVFKTLMGQTMEMARAHAEKVFDSVVHKLFEAVAGWFSMSPEQFLEEVSEFRRRLDQKEIKPPVEHAEEMRLRLLMDFLDKENFISMYVGCIVSLIGPMLYCTVLPTMYDSHRREVTTESVNAHLSDFKKFIDACQR